uniref:Replicase n=1 Tax=Infectious hematopoietic necrosis virus TaxID=11290 RepID=A0A7S7YG63_9RHAB|nr:L protein [Infectious hematopoietic necrosis virus]
MDFFDLDIEIKQERLPAECSLNSPLNYSLSAQLTDRMTPRTENVRRQRERLRSHMREHFRVKDLSTLDNDSTRLHARLTEDLITIQSPEIDSSVLENWPPLKSYYASLDYTLPEKTAFKWEHAAPYWNLFAQLRAILLQSQKIKKQETGTRELYSCGPLQIEFVEGVVLYFTDRGSKEEFTKSGELPSVTPYTDFLAWIKIISQRAQAVLMAVILRVTDKGLSPLPESLLAIYQNVDDILKRAGQPAIDLLKLWEPLVITKLGELLGDRFGLEEDFRNTIRGEATKLAKNLFISRGLNRLMDILDQQTDAQPLFQFFGLFKHFAYPRVFSRDTIQAIQEVSDRPSSISAVDFLHDQCEIRKEFYVRYINAYHRAPGLDLSALSPSSFLRDSLERGKIPNERSPLYSNKEWYFVRFTKSIEWPVSDTLSTFLSDKAITRDRPAWIEDGHSGRDMSEKRLLLKFIKENFSSVADIVGAAEAIYNNEEDRLIALKVKEMELKIKGRGFGLMTFMPRLLQVLRESIAKKTQKLFPEITMTSSDLDMKKRKFMLSKKSDDRRGFIHVNKSLDINKFCTSQRQFNSNAVFSSLDELMGTFPLFSRVHEIFEKTWIVDGSSSDPPNLAHFTRILDECTALGLDTPHIWADGVFSGLKGGIEGLCQYVWTICLLLRVERVMQKTALTHYILAQGDNVIITIIVPVEIHRDGTIPEQESRRILALSRDIDLSLESELEKSGLTLKIEETLTSENISIYGKDLHCPQHLTLAIKKAASAAIISSEQYQDVPTFLSGLGTSLEALSECVNNKVGVHLFGVIMGVAGWRDLATHQTWRGWRYPYHKKAITGRIRASEMKLSKGEPTELSISVLSKRRRETETLIELLSNSLLGSALGMLAFPTPLDLEKRGVGDYITHRLTIARKALLSGHLDPRIGRKVESACNIPLSSRTDLSKLFDSPFSLNIATEEDATAVIKRQATKILRLQEIKNEKLKAQIDNMDKGIATLDAALAGATNINPRLNYMIRSITDEKESEMFVTKFASARTMRTLAMNHSSELPIVILLEMKSQQKETYTIWRTKRPPVTMWKCSTVLAKELRDTSWGKNIIGGTSPSPIEAMETIHIDPTEWEDRRSQDAMSINYYLSRAGMDEQTAKLTRGFLVPYYGTQTKPLVAKAYLELKGNPRTNKALLLLSVRESLVKTGSNLDKLIIKLCSHALDIDVASLPALRAQEEAAAGEGLRGGIKESMSPVGPDNFYTNITHKVFNRKWATPYHVNIADFIIQGLIETRRHLLVNERMNGLLPVSSVKCTSCFREKEREFFDIPEEFTWKNESKTSDPAYTYFTTWCDLPRVSNLPEMDQRSATRLLGRGLALNRSSSGEIITKFYSMPMESQRLLHPVELLLGYGEGVIFGYLRSQHINHGALFHIGDESLAKKLRRYVLDTKTQHAKQIGYLFQDEDSLHELLGQGLCPYIPRSIPLTITELTNACAITTIRATEVILSTKARIHHMPVQAIDESDVDTSRLAANTMQTMLGDHRPMNLVHLDCDLTHNMVAWESEVELDILKSENFHIDGLLVELTARELPIGDTPWKQRDWTCSNDPKIIAKGIKTKSLFIHQGVTGAINLIPDLLVVIGGGLGGCAVPYLQEWPDTPIIFATLFDERERISEDGDLIVPPELLVRGMAPRMIEREILEAELCDITNEGNRRLLIRLVAKNKGGGKVVLIDEIENRGAPESLLQSSLQDLFEKLDKVCKLTSVHTVRESTVEQFSQRVNSIKRSRKAVTLHWNRYNRRDQFEALVIVKGEEAKSDYRISTITSAKAFRKIDEQLEIDGRLSSTQWSLPTLPSREKNILFGYVSSVFLKMNLALSANDMDRERLIETIEGTAPGLISWKEKLEHRDHAHRSDIEEKGITQDKIFNLICLSWVLKGLRYGVWDTDAQSIVAQTVYITRGPKLCPLGEKPKRIFASFKLQSGKRVEDAKGFLSALLHLEGFFPLGEQ